PGWLNSFRKHRRKYQASVLFLALLLHLLRGTYDLLAIKIRVSAEMAALFFPSEQRCSIGCTVLADGDKSCSFSHNIRRSERQRWRLHKHARSVLPLPRVSPRQLPAQILQYGLFPSAAGFPG